MRCRSTVARHRSVKRIRKRAKGYRGGRSKLLKTAKETIIRAEHFATRDRKQKKRMFRRLWITRISAAARNNGMRYCDLIKGLQLAEVKMNRKMLSELAIHNENAFSDIVALAKSKLAPSEN